jgi:DNA polymerase-1
MASPERLFLLDGMALAYRAYYSFISRPLINSKGENTSAIFGFVNALMRILDEERPDHVAVVFDTKEPTFRHQMYAEYKATRQKMPEDMAAQLDKLKEVVRAFNTPLLELPGFEADDIIGTLAKRAEKQNVLTFMVTGDKDYMQLISPIVKMYKPGKAGSDTEIVDEAGVRAKFGVTPDRVTDVLGLIGDKSDNVPGVPGIGEKTAIPLIQKFGSIENLYAHLEQIPQQGVRDKLTNNREKAFLSKKLVTIDVDVPIAIDFHQLRAARRDTAKLLKLFTDLEFKTLASRLRETMELPEKPGVSAERVEPESGQTAATESVSAATSITDIGSDQHTYHCVTTREELDTLREKLATAELFVFDTETTSTDPLQAELVGISLCLEEREAFYVPVRLESRPGTGRGPLFSEETSPTTDPGHTRSALSASAVLEKLRSVFENPRIHKVAQNAKYDILVLKAHGIEVQGLCFDTMVASYVLRADGQHNLNALALEYLQYRMISYEDLVGKGKSQKPIINVPLESVAEYSAEDADMTMRIYHRMVPRLLELKLLKLCEEIEFPLIPVLGRMEFAGIALDVPALADMSKDLERQLDNLVRDILKDAGQQFNINSTQQLGEILFKKLNLPTVRKTKTGFSTDVAVLETLRGMHPIIDRLLEYRQLTKLKSTYIDALPSLINPRTGRVHTSFNQTIAATGRLSSSDPNLQNIPIRTEIGRSIRKAFVPGAAHRTILSADYSQIELRVMAHMSGDEGLVEAFKNNEDIHLSTASKVFGVSREEVSRDMRRKAKEVNFGIMYGIGPFGLANRLEISQSEARDIISRYFERFPKVKQYINDTIDAARRNGYVSTLLGRRRYLPDINSRNQNIRGNAERQAINMPIQGTAADMIKLAMIEIDETMTGRKLKSRMLLQVHDELVFEMEENERAMLEKLVVTTMQNALQLNVPVKVEIGSGKNWLEAH